MVNGLLAGAAGAVSIELFLLAVFRVFGVPVIRLNQSDAAHLVGKSAYSGGLTTACLGAALHLLVSLCWGLIAAFVIQRFVIARQHPVVFGTVFGLAVMTVMNWIVVPLSREPLPRLTPIFLLILIIAHTAFFGIPVALVAKALHAKNR